MEGYSSGPLGICFYASQNHEYITVNQGEMANIDPEACCPSHTHQYVTYSHRHVICDIFIHLKGSIQHTTRTGRTSNCSVGIVCQDNQLINWLQQCGGEGFFHCNESMKMMQHTV